MLTANLVMKLYCEGKMNKRILELAKQAGFCVIEDQIYTPTIDENITEVQARFAEMIVRECAKVANENVGVFTPGCGNSVLEHFGVK